MAPEVLRGEMFDEMSDLYGFGVVLWEMLTLEQPWKEVDPVQLPGIVGFQGRRLRLPPEAPPGCPPDYISLIADTWHHHPQRRPTMREVLERLTTMHVAARSQMHAIV
ncbi:kinase-like domain-containing protein [Baffinella frigidus]|nr:kinase-like domain-containing protein [Cryptophyta sp. CCMP2293]